MNQGFAYIDDNRSNLDCIEQILSNDFPVKTFQNPFEFLNEYNGSTFDAILLDIHMPLMSGFDLYEKIIEHEKYDGCPIFFISSDDSDLTRIRSFSLGAIDFISRDMSPSEFIVRIKNQLNFFQKNRNVIELGDLKLNLSQIKAYLKEEELKLTFIEFKLLCHLIRSFPGRSSKEELMENVWSGLQVLDATIYTHTFNLNSKITEWEYEVTSERGKGTVLSKKVNIK